MAYGAHGLPGDRFTGGQGYRLAQLLARQNVNNGTNAGGMAHVGNQLLQALLMKRDMEAVEKDRADQAAVGPAMQKGMNAKPWVNPDTGSATIPEYQPPGTMGPPQMVPTAPAGGMPGAMASLAELGDNPHAGKLTQQLLVAKAQSEDQLKNAQALRMSPQWQPDTPGIKEFQFAKSQGYTGSFEDWKKTHADGKDVPMTVKEWQFFNNLPKDQQAQFLTMKRANPYLNLGGQMVQPNPVQPGQAMGGFYKTLPPEQLPETKGAQKAATVQAEAGAKAAIDLPKVEAQAKGMLDLLNKVETHPGFSTVVGAPGLTGIPAKMGLPIPGTEAADFTVLLDQIKGKQFLEAFETLKGGGQITEVEGRKATEAMARMNTAQSEKEFKAALQEFKGIVQQGADRAKVKAAPQYNRRSADPKPGGMTFLGFE